MKRGVKSMSNMYSLIYIGYYYPKGGDNILLCVSDELFKVQYYLQHIRGLNECNADIREVTLNWETTQSLYGDYILERYEEPYDYLTVKDIQGLTSEIEQSIERYTNLQIELHEYRKTIENIPKFQGSLSALQLAEREIAFHLSKVKNIRKLAFEIINQSPITSKNIHEYLGAVEVISEDRELTEMFYRKVTEDD